MIFSFLRWRKGLLPFLIFCLLPNKGATQIAYWQRYFGGKGFDVGKQVYITPEETLILAGDTYSQDGLGGENHSTSGDIVVFHFATQGRVFWKRTLGGSGREELSKCIPVAGGYVVLGTTDSEDGDPGFGKGEMDIWVVKLDQQGNTLWKSRFGGSGNDKGFDIIQVSDGGFLVTGSSGSANGNMTGQLHHGGLDSWVAKLDVNGKIIWQRLMGGRREDWGRKLLEVSPGTYWVFHATTSADGDVVQHMAQKDAWLTALDAYGNTLWQKSYGGTQNDEIHTAVLDTADKTVVCGGATYSRDGDLTAHRGMGDFWLLKMDLKGDVVWSQSYGGSRSEGVSSLVITPDGNYVAAGLTKSRDMDVSQLQGFYDGWVLKVSRTSGQKIWARSLGYKAKDVIHEIISTPKGGFLGIGFSELPYGEDNMLTQGYFGGADFWLCNFGDPEDPASSPFYTPTLLSGKVIGQEEQQPLFSDITLTNNWTLDSLTSTHSDEQSGEYELDLPPEGLVSIGVMAQGYLFYGMDILMDTLKAQTHLTQDIELAPIRIGASLVLGNIYFDVGKWDLLPASYAELERLHKFLRLNPRVVIEIGGHTDNTGNPQDKIQLSLNRANAVKDYLLRRGIKEYRLQVKGYGMMRPIASNTTYSGRRKNRRVEFKIVLM